jgi:hypothetical protein
MVDTITVTDIHKILPRDFDANEADFAAVEGMSILQNMLEGHVSIGEADQVVLIWQAATTQNLECVLDWERKKNFDASFHCLFLTLVRLLF